MLITSENPLDSLNLGILLGRRVEIVPSTNIRDMIATLSREGRTVSLVVICGKLAADPELEQIRSVYNGLVLLEGYSHHLSDLGVADVCIFEKNDLATAADGLLNMVQQAHNFIRGDEQTLQARYGLNQRAHKVNRLEFLTLLVKIDDSIPRR